MNNHGLAVKNCFSILVLCCLGMPAAFAQLLNTETPGQGMNPAPVIAGDALPPPPVPSGSSSNANSSIFPVMPEQIPQIICLRTDTYSHNTHQYMGKRTVLTIRTSILNAMQKDLIAGILQLGLSPVATNGEHAISLDVSASQLEQIQNVLMPSLSNEQSSQPTWLFHYLPIVRNFCQWAVLLGVVFATVMLSVAAYGTVMSHRGSADKIISTIAGLMVLLMAYTIYSLLIANAGSRPSSSSTASSSINSSNSQSLPSTATIPSNSQSSAGIAAISTNSSQPIQSSPLP